MVVIDSAVVDVTGNDDSDCDVAVVVGDVVDVGSVVVVVSVVVSGVEVGVDVVV